MQLRNLINKQILVRISGLSEGSRVRGVLNSVRPGMITVMSPKGRHIIPIRSISSVMKANRVSFSLIQVIVANFSSNNVTLIDSNPRDIVNLGVGKAPRDIGVTPTTPNGSNVYVLNSGSNSVSMFSTTTEASTTIEKGIGTLPKRIAILPNGAFAYVTNFESNDISIINTGTNTVTQRIKGFSGPCGIAASSNRVYVVNSNLDFVSVLRVSDNTLIGKPIPVGSSPDSIVLTPDGSKAYVTNTVNHNVSVISTRNNKVIGKPIPVGKEPLGIAVTPNGAFVYVANNMSNTISVIRTSDDTVVNTISSNKLFFPLGVAIDPNGTVYVTNNGTPNNLVPNSGTIVVIKNNMVVEQINLIDARGNAGDSPGAIAIAVFPPLF
ncbi:YncE family protein [Hazenella sp. IB182353]|uniref:YncE family protein n=1 Tax=Polycladospora coralii TaxID=2771432 RepID=UPI001745FF95|nr:YncE family protein [Polycladospora coralii]MBS7529626.1 YncE family protein [Polycladospora coralii]